MQASLQDLAQPSIRGGCVPSPRVVVMSEDTDHLSEAFFGDLLLIVLLRSGQEADVCQLFLHIQSSVLSAPLHLLHHLSASLLSCEPMPLERPLLRVSPLLRQVSPHCSLFSSLIGFFSGQLLSRVANAFRLGQFLSPYRNLPRASFLHLLYTTGCSLLGYRNSVVHLLCSFGNLCISPQQVLLHLLFISVGFLELSGQPFLRPRQHRLDFCSVCFLKIQELLRLCQLLPLRKPCIISHCMGLLQAHTQLCYFDVTMLSPLFHGHAQVPDAMCDVHLCPISIGLSLLGPLLQAQCLGLSLQKRCLRGIAIESPFVILAFSFDQLLIDLLRRVHVLQPDLLRTQRTNHWKGLS
mmetsp:Transcript_51698/g.123057  ORF Transcript_51698/g.123057 Transcript_51698/m.123057 type:complete len:352 (-) Transcript_51698:121-1176(-)